MTRTSTGVRRAAIILALVLGLGLSGCGEDEPDSAEEPSAGSTSTPAEDPSEEPAGPVCTEVWVAGATLPEKYSGCQDAEKAKWMEAMVYHCSSGQRLVTFGRTFYAAKGEVINESETPLARNPEFQKVLASCGA